MAMNSKTKMVFKGWLALSQDERRDEKRNDAVDNRRHREADHHPGIQKLFADARKPHDRTDGDAEHHCENQSESDPEQRLVQLIEGLSGNNVVGHRFENGHRAWNNCRREYRRQDQPQNEQGNNRKNSRECNHCE